MPAGAVSIRAPLLRAGRRRRINTVGNRWRVSIRAPLLRAGRPMFGVQSGDATQFQSAPRSCERGDTGISGDAGGAGPVSIRAPLLRAGRLVQFLFQIFERVVSIRAPLLRAGRHTPRRSRPSWNMSFNPRPALASGATLKKEIFVVMKQVSIRAPLLRAGRRLNGWRGCWTPSVSIRAPLLRAGRQRGLTTHGKTRQSFNPRPALASGATVRAVGYAWV